MNASTSDAAWGLSHVALSMLCHDGRKIMALMVGISHMKWRVAQCVLDLCDNPIT